MYQKLKSRTRMAKVAFKKFNYEMIQKSVWVGPSPLPKEFMDYVSKIKLKESIKTFKLTKSYNISR